MSSKPDWMTAEQWREKENARHRKYDAAHPNKKAARDVRYYRLHRAKKLEYNKRYRELNKETIAADKKWRKLLRVLEAMHGK